MVAVVKRDRQRCSLTGASRLRRPNAPPGYVHNSTYWRIQVPFNLRTFAWAASLLVRLRIFSFLPQTCAIDAMCRWRGLI